jgi:hypothetical protein
MKSKVIHSGAYSLVLIFFTLSFLVSWTFTFAATGVTGTTPPETVTGQTPGETVTGQTPPATKPPTTPSTNSNNGNNTTPESGTKPGGTNSIAGETRSITNPIDAKDINELILKVIQVVVIFLMPVIVLCIMYAGFLYVTAAGNAEKVSHAHNALLWSIVGGVIILGAELIIQVIQGTIAAF